MRRSNLRPPQRCATIRSLQLNSSVRCSSRSAAVLAIFRHNEVGGIHTETVLIVDDASCVLEYLRRALLIEGYTVLTASDGQAALDASMRWQNQIDLLITDVAIRRTSCTLMVDDLRAQRPSLKVFYISGHSRGVVADLGVRADAFFLQKPFLPAQLVQAVRHVLDGPRKGLPECLTTAADRVARRAGTAGAG
jgi:DNA-binding NtrC family response regulator